MNRYRDWYAQALRDLEKAKLDLEYKFWEWACFTSQQCAEKAVKSLLMYYGYDVWGHAITPILRRMDKLEIPTFLIEYAQLLDVLYIPTRYPNGLAEGIPADYFNKKKAQEAIEAADAILQFCKDHLPE